MIPFIGWACCTSNETRGQQRDTKKVEVVDNDSIAQDDEKKLSSDSLVNIDTLSSDTADIVTDIYRYISN